jgi:hypothetical protein
VALLLAGLIPSELAWRMLLMTIGFSIAAIGIWLWIEDAIDEYRKLPD